MSNASVRRVAAAGLTATATIACPTPAMAATASIDPMPYVNFALGCVTGAALTSSAALLLAMRDRGDADSAAHSATSARTRGHAMGDGVRHAPDSLADRGVRVQSVDDLVAGSYVLGDYSDVATNYVRGQGVAGQMAARAAGVRDTLVARLGGDFFDDLPVIERADGTVGDVGTSWWDARLASQTYRGPALADADVASASPDAPRTSDSTVFMTPLASDANTTLDMGRRRVGRERDTAFVAAMAPRVRSAYIASKVAEVDNGTFPERRPATDLDDVDAFDQALAAMDERMGRLASSVSAAEAVMPAVADARTSLDGSSSDEVGVEVGRDEAQSLPLDGVVVTEVNRVDEVHPYPSLPIIDAGSSGSFLRVIPGGQTKGRVSATDVVRQGLARHFRREAVAL